MFIKMEQETDTSTWTELAKVRLTLINKGYVTKTGVLGVFNIYIYLLYICFAD